MNLQTGRDNVAIVSRVSAYGLIGLLTALPAMAQQFDSEAPRQASRLLQPAQYQSSIHKVDDAVPVVVHTYLFTLQTKWGPMKAYGYDALVLRLRELYAIQALEDTSKTEAYGKALGKAAGAPIRAVGNLVQDPGGTISGVPRGIGAMFEIGRASCRERV